MILGLNTAILGSCDFEEMVKYSSEIGYKCLEVCCWPIGKAERRYSGVTHIDVEGLSDSKITEINAILNKYSMTISALGYYPNVLDNEFGEKAIEHLKKVIDAAVKLNVSIVTTFIGKDKDKSIEQNFEDFCSIWPAIIQYAENKKIKIAIENCPMFFSKDEWPGGLNLASSPYLWRKMFDFIKSDYFGLNYDPSHFFMQGMDYLKPIYEFKDKIFHIHFKDLKVYKDKIDEYGIFTYPLNYMAPKLVGLGGIDWAAFCSSLYDIEFKGFACVEVEDRTFEDSFDDILKSLQLSYGYIRQFVY